MRLGKKSHERLEILVKNKLTSYVVSSFNTMIPLGATMNTPTHNECKLDLYYRDTRISDNHCSKKTEMTMTEHNVVTIREAIWEFFKVTQDNDKLLFRSVIATDCQFNFFEFVRTEAPGIIEGITVSGDRKIPFKDKPEPFSAVARGANKIHVMITSVFGISDYDICFEELCEKRRDDIAVVALYNSSTYARVIQGSSNIGFMRTFEII